MKFLLILLLLLQAQIATSETTVPAHNQDAIDAIVRQVWNEATNLSTIPNYPPRCAEFHDTNPRADACAPEGWVPSRECPNRGQVQRGNILMGMAEKIIAAHGYRHSEAAIVNDNTGTRGYSYESRLLVCKMFKESTFRPQNKAETSSAGGLAQVTRRTARALMSGFHGERLNFRSKFPQFSHITDGDELYEAMKTSIGLQIEVGLAVMQLKNLEGEALHRKNPSRHPPVVGVRSLLRLYYGNASSVVNDAYAADIINCSRCVRDNENVFKQLCLSQAEGKKVACPGQ